MGASADTLEIARKKFPGSPASLDALCRRYGIDNSSRTLHGALLDSEILAEVYLELIGGRQPDLVLSSETESRSGNQVVEVWRPKKRETALAARTTEEERAAHTALVDGMGDKSLWSRFS